MAGDRTTDLPTDYASGDTLFDLEDPLSRLQTMLNQKNVDIDSLDLRGEGQDTLFRGFEPHQLRLITGVVDGNPEMDIKSNSVRDLNDKFDKNIDTSDPNYIFRSDVFTRNNVATIQRGNQAFAKDRDLYIVPPPVDSQNKMFELLKGRG